MWVFPFHNPYHPNSSTKSHTHSKISSLSTIPPTRFSAVYTSINSMVYGEEHFRIVHSGGKNIEMKFIDMTWRDLMFTNTLTKFLL